MGCLDWNGGMERSTYKTSHYVLPFRLPDMGVEELGVSITGLEYEPNGGMDYGMDYGVLFTVDGTTSFFCLFPLNQTTYTAIKC